MPRPREAANNSRATRVARIKMVTPPAGVLTQATAALIPPFSCWRARARAEALSTTEIFLIRGVVLNQHATIDGQRHAGDHARCVTRQKQNGVGDILGLAHATQRDLSRSHGLRLFRGECATEPRCGRTRADGVYPDSVRGELVGGVAGQAQKASLG